MKPKLRVLLLTLGCNLPWILLWLRVSRSPGELTGGVPILFILLILGGTGLILVPCLLIKELFRKRWILIVMLAFVNIFWCLKWIDNYAGAVAGDPSYGKNRLFFAGMIILSSTVVCLIYWSISRILSLIQADSGRGSD